jgi:Ni/Co efflux regulator RcnB
MKKFSFSIIALTAIIAVSGPALAQPGHDEHGGDHAAPPAHSDFRKGGHIAPEDWNRAQPVDYQAHHLRRPPHGYEWRQVDGKYVLAAAATGVIASLILAGH